jgi:phospholipase/carboxylesterase
MADLDGPRLDPRGGEAKRLVIFLHGYGADGNDLIDLGRAWQEMLPQTAFVSPHAPEPCGQAPVGKQWFALTFRDPDERWVGVNKAAPALEAFIDKELARWKLPPSALALVGFSQGTMMALHVGLRRATPLAAIVGYSGMLVLPNRPAPEEVAASIKSKAAGAAGSRQRGRADPGAGFVPRHPDAGGTGNPRRMAHFARHRAWHRRRRAAAWRRISRPPVQTAALNPRYA